MTLRSSLLSLVLCVACGPAPEGAETFHLFAERVSDDDFTVADNRLVAERLHGLVTERRAWAQGALDRRSEVAGTIEPALEARGLPSELMAVAFVESGFSDVAADPALSEARGVWQFIPETARAYGLRVDEQVDERADLERSTGAALDLLADLHHEFSDWGLAFAGYNQGAPAVRAAIAAEDTDDPWTLIEAGALKPYAADVMAGAILLEEGEALGFAVTP